MLTYGDQSLVLKIINPIRIAQYWVINVTFGIANLIADLTVRPGQTSELCPLVSNSHKTEDSIFIWVLLVNVDDSFLFKFEALPANADWFEIYPLVSGVRFTMDKPSDSSAFNYFNTELLNWQFATRKQVCVIQLID